MNKTMKIKELRDYLDSKKGIIKVGSGCLAIGLVTGYCKGIKDLARINNTANTCFGEIIKYIIDNNDIKPIEFEEF